MSIFLDLLISTYTNIQSFCFLNVLNQKNIYYLIFIGLVIDFIVAKTNGVITLILLFLYLVNAYINNYYLRNVFNYIFIIVILKFPFSILGFLIHFIFIYLMKNHIIKW